jgi:hypothetical protein
VRSGMLRVPIPGLESTRRRSRRGRHAGRHPGMHTGMHARMWERTGVLAAVVVGTAVTTAVVVVVIVFVINPGMPRPRAGRGGGTLGSARGSAFLRGLMFPGRSRIRDRSWFFHVPVGSGSLDQVNLACCAGPREHGAAGTAGAGTPGIEIFVVVAANALSFPGVAATEVYQGLDGPAVGEAELLVIAGGPRARARAAGAA